MILIDTHAHIYSNQFENDESGLVKRALSAGVKKIFMPNIRLESVEPMLEFSKNYPDVCFPMLGLHPCDVDSGYKEQLDALYQYFPKEKFWAVGEIGLDYYHDKTFINEQKDAFHIQINWALEQKIPISIHSREANDDAIEIVAEYKNKGLRGVFHCFSGSIEQAQKMIDLGFYLGIGGVATFKNGGLDKILPSIGLKHLVLETDSPYLAPVPFRGKRNEPSYIPLVSEKIAEILEISSIEVAEVTTKNANELFNQH